MVLVNEELHYCKINPSMRYFDKNSVLIDILYLIDELLTQKRWTKPKRK